MGATLLLVGASIGALSVAAWVVIFGGLHWAWACG